MVDFFFFLIPPTHTHAYPYGGGGGRGVPVFFARRGTHIGPTPYPHTNFLKEYLQTSTLYTYPSETLRRDYSDFNIKVNKLYQQTH